MFCRPFPTFRKKIVAEIVYCAPWCSKSIFEVETKYSTRFECATPKTDKKHHQIIEQLKLKNVFITKADKSNNIVILDNSTYDERVQKMIDEGPYEITDGDQLSVMVRDINKCLDKHLYELMEIICPEMLQDMKPLTKQKFGLYAKKVRWTLKVKNPHIPRFHGYTKIHKDPPDKTRPIASNIDAPCENIAKWLVE